MRSIARILVLGALAAAAAGCRAPAPSGTARVAIGLGRAALAIPGATRISLEVFGADMPRIVADLPLDGSTALVEVPAGAARVFVVQVYAGRILTHHGSTVADLVAGLEQTVTIVLEAQQPDTTPPAVVSTSPAGGATGVATGAGVQVTFSEAIDPASVTASSFTLVGPGGPVAARAIAVSGATATFTPPALAAGTTYTATVTTGVTDLAGNPLAAPFSWSFTTAVLADTTPPAVVSTSPADGATGVPTGVPVQVTFSEAVDPASVTASSFTLAGPGGPVAASAIAVSGATATFTPAALDAGTSYTATVTVAVTDLAGNPLAAPSSWTFTTAVAPPSGYACEPPVELDAAYALQAAATAVGTSGEVLAMGVPQVAAPQQTAIWSRVHRPGLGWADAGSVSDLLYSANVGDLRIVGSEQGDAIATWIDNPQDGFVTLWARRWDGSLRAWAGAPTLVQQGTCPPFPCDVADSVGAHRVVIDGAGDATIVWQEVAGFGRTRVFARRWTRAGGLEPAPTTLSPDLPQAYDLAAGAGFGGTVHVLWGEPTGSVARAWRGGLWEVATGVPVPFGPDGLAVDDAGSAIAIDASSGILVVRTPPGPDAWGSPRALWNTGNQPRIAADGGGRAVAIWRDPGGPATMAAVFDPLAPGGTPPGWTDATPIEPGRVNNLSFALVSNRAGDVLFGGDRMDAGERPTASIRAFRPSSGWEPGGMLDVGEAANSEIFREGLAVDPSGRATVLWRRRGSGIPFASRCGSAGGFTPVSLVRVSVASDGAEGNGRSRQPSISADGRHVAFTSEATNLVQGDTNGFDDVFVHDLSTGETTRVSVASDGAQANGNSGRPSISGDGRFVAFLSGATNLVPGDAISNNDVFVHDRVTRQTVRVNESALGVSTGNHDAPSISADGATVLLGPADGSIVGAPGGFPQVYASRWQTRTIALASATAAGLPGDADSNLLLTSANNALLSANGARALFRTNASNLVTPPGPGLLACDLATRACQEVNRSQAGARVGFSFAALSGDGRWAAFSSTEDFHPGDANGSQDVFVRDLVAGTTEIVSVRTDGASGDLSSSEPSLSADGRFVAFWSAAQNLVAGRTTSIGNVFVRDRPSGTTTRVTVGLAGAEPDGVCNTPALSAEGNAVAFSCNASNLVPGDTNGVFDVFVAPRP